MTKNQKQPCLPQRGRSKEKPMKEGRDPEIESPPTSVDNSLPVRCRKRSTVRDRIYKNISPNKAMGPDGIHLRVLKKSHSNYQIFFVTFFTSLQIFLLTVSKAQAFWSVQWELCIDGAKISLNLLTFSSPI